MQLPMNTSRNVRKVLQFVSAQKLCNRVVIIARIVHQYPKLADLVHMLAVDFDIVDGNIGADDGNRYHGCDSVGSLKGFAFL